MKLNELSLWYIRCFFILKIYYINLILIDFFFHLETAFKKN